MAGAGSVPARAACRRRPGPVAADPSLPSGPTPEQMGEAPKPRLRLSRRRPPPEDGCPDGRPWFLREAGGCERPWAALLRLSSAELDAGREFPPLPARPAQEPGRGPPPAAPDVFTVGRETFAWTPFPPAPRGPARRAPVSARMEDTPREAGALRSCPLCQAAFPPVLTQLDIDSHLAQCLAAGTEAEEW